MAAGITPPGSVLEPPLTPPPTAEKPLSRSAQSVVNCLRLHRANHRPRSWWEGRLRPDDYTQVLRALDADKSLRDYVEDKNNEPLADFAKEVEHFATSRILIPEVTPDGAETYSRREPDASFGHRQAHYPGVIVEVCYSQKSRRVSHLADEYILNTDGSVNAVLAFDIDYKGSKRATVTMWRPEYVTVNGVEEFRAATVIEAQPFRTDSGLPTEGIALRLSLRDFATEELARDHVGLEREIVITSKQLWDFLSSAEARQQIQTQHKGSINRIRPGALKRRRPQTPPEQLSSEDEGSVTRGREIKRGRQSSDYRPSSSPGDSTSELH
ncbi:hypothetical protein N7460_000322 [Penicillium canescens]|uniref:Uncharacterized protein n=1 Tax=Penicillium canescens TaxID=5083 RepID=A0AAD6INV6_PENCN|nr:hypothetical protein N7460_000322 [Penicillium canescens]